MHLLFLRFFDPETNKFTKTSAGSKNSVLSRTFVHLILDPIYKVMRFIGKTICLMLLRKMLEVLFVLVL